MIIDNVDFETLEAEKYWNFTSSFKGNKTEEVLKMVQSNEYYGALKRDGAYYRFIKDMDGNMRLQGRSKSVNGGYLNKIDNVPYLMPFFNRLPNGTCLIGEIYIKSNEKSTSTTSIMGCLPAKAVARQEKEHVRYYIFDIYAFSGESFLTHNAATRFETLMELSKAYVYSDVDWAEYFDASTNLWQHIQDALANDLEGFVITRKNSLVEPGKRTARKTLKIKKELQESLDLVIIGANKPSREYTGKEIISWTYWEDMKTGNRISGEAYDRYSAGEAIEPVTKMYFKNGAGSLKLGAYKDGELLHVGNLSGLDEDILLNWKEYVGRVVEVGAMEILPTGGIRHPKCLGWRSDKNPEECDWYKIFG